MVPAASQKTSLSELSTPKKRCVCLARNLEPKFKHSNLRKMLFFISFTTPLPRSTRKKRYSQLHGAFFLKLPKLTRFWKPHISSTRYGNVHHDNELERQTREDWGKGVMATEFINRVSCLLDNVWTAHWWALKKQRMMFATFWWTDGQIIFFCYHLSCSILLI